MSDKNQMNTKNTWLAWAKELQFIAQVGLEFTNDAFDTQRYERIREIAAEIISKQSDIDMAKVTGLFCNEIGYQTPKIETRAAIFKDDKILLVKEKNGLWSMPGGWVDVNESIKENIIKEVKEESGYDVQPDKLIALQDRSKHNQPEYAYGVCKVFVACKLLSEANSFQSNPETDDKKFFDMSGLPQLATEKNTVAQLQLCYKAANTSHWQALFD